MTKRGASLAAVASRTCIVVLGMHRSDTSALARMLSLLGAELLKHMLGATHSNEKDYWGSEWLVALHDEMLAEDFRC